MSYFVDRPALLALGTAVPAYCMSQQTIARWVMDAFAEQPALQRLVRILYAHSGIDTRYTCTPDYLRPVQDSRFSPARPLHETPTTAERMAIYERESVPLAVQAARVALEQYAHKTEQPFSVVRDSITHVVVVSCTGFFAPGIDFVLAQQLGLRPDVQRTLIGFMGCSAAFNGLRSADHIVRADPDARVLLVTVELCSLHSQPGNARDDLISTSLFADGAAAALIGTPTPEEGDYLSIDAFHTDRKPDTQSEMVWRIGDHGFTLRLSPRVPDHLADVAPAALGALFCESRPAFWAIHPGGRAIVDRLAEIFELGEDDVCASRDVLRNYGNLSSATILFVLQKILAEERNQRELTDPAGHRYLGNANGASGSRAGVAMAFGPGLVIEMARLTYVPAPSLLGENGQAAPATHRSINHG